jgi:hypothetical protein
VSLVGSHRTNKSIDLATSASRRTYNQTPTRPTPPDPRPTSTDALLFTVEARSSQSAGEPAPSTTTDRPMTDEPADPSRFARQRNANAIDGA